MNILLTGATGFLGRGVVCYLCNRTDFRVRALVRNNNHQLPVAVSVYNDANWAVCNDLSGLFQDIDVVIHSAARVHVFKENASCELSAYRCANVNGTLNLARQAVLSGVKRFIFISSIKVNGDSTTFGHRFRADDSPAPGDLYSTSKMEAEIGLRELAEETGLEVVIIRPPLVYGPGVKANFRRMLKWVYRGIPLPLAKIENRRSMVALENLVDLIIECVDHPAARNQTFLISDGEDVSSRELLRRIGEALRKPVRLFAVPEEVLYSGAKLLGQRENILRLCGSLQIDISKTTDVLGWIPPVTLNDGIIKTAEWYIESIIKKN